MKAVQEVTIPLKNFAQLIAGCALDERQRRWFYGFLASEIGCIWTIGAKTPWMRDVLQAAPAAAGFPAA